MTSSSQQVFLGHRRRTYGYLGQCWVRLGGALAIHGAILGYLRPSGRYGFKALRLVTLIALPVPMLTQVSKMAIPRGRCRKFQKIACFALEVSQKWMPPCYLKLACLT